MSEAQVLMTVSNFSVFFFQESFPGRGLYFSKEAVPHEGTSTLMGDGGGGS